MGAGEAGNAAGLVEEEDACGAPGSQLRGK